jgi:predicted nucleic-acid-binding Zn-ribbon protein
MKNGACPKCSSNEIYHSPESGFYPASMHPYGMRVMEGEGFWEEKVHVVNLEHYVCRACGFFETYASANDPNFALLEKASNWEKLNKEQE